jgi:hypothetical protein
MQRVVEWWDPFARTGDGYRAVSVTMRTMSSTDSTNGGVRGAFLVRCALLTEARTCLQFARADFSGRRK